MSRAFDGDKKLPFHKIKLSPSTITVESLEREFQERSQATLCVTLPGLDESCLGYVVSVKKQGERFLLVNISGDVELKLDSAGELVEVILHVAGLAYSSRVQRAFQQVRNEIGGTSAGVTLSAAL